MQTQSINLDVVTGGVPQVIHISQYDTGARTLEFVLYASDGSLDLAGVTAKISGKKPDGFGFEYDATITNGVVSADCTDQMTAVAGVVECAITLTNTDGQIQTARFNLDVKPAPLNDDTVISDSDFPVIEQAIQAADTITELVNDAEVAIDEAVDSAKSTVGGLVEDAEAWAAGTRGGVDVPSTDPAYQNSSKYWAGIAEQYAQGGLVYRGSITFADIPTSGMKFGDMYNMDEDFMTDTRFQEGAGKKVKAGTNIAWNGKKWDLLAVSSDAEKIQLGTDEWVDMPAFSDWTNFLKSTGVQQNYASDIHFESGYSPIDGEVVCDIPTGWMYYNYVINNPTTLANMIGKTIEFGALTYDATFEATNMVSLRLTVNEEDIYYHLTAEELGRGSKYLPYNSTGVAIAVEIPEGCTKIEINYVSATHGAVYTAGTLTLGDVYIFDVNELTLPSTDGTLMSVNRFLTDQSSYDNNSLNLLKNGKIVSVNNVGEATQLGGTGGDGGTSDCDAAIADIVNVYGSKNLNIYPYAETTKTVSGITFTDLGDGTIMVDGTATATAVFNCHSRGQNDLNNLIIPNGEYLLNGCPSGGGQGIYWISVARTHNSAFGELGRDYGEGVKFTADGDDFSDDEVDLQIQIDIASGVTVNNLVFRPMLRMAGISDDTYEPYVPTNKVLNEKKMSWSANNVLGAKNLNSYPYYGSTVTLNGITWTDNGDGTITANGTATSNSDFICHSRTKNSTNSLLLPNGKYIISGCPDGGSSSTYRIGLGCTKNNAFYNLGFDFGSGSVITLAGDDYSTDEVNVQISCTILIGQTVSNLTFKPMFRIAEDTDDTFEPYAMTNRELTEEIFKLNKGEYEILATTNYGITRREQLVSLYQTFKDLTDSEKIRVCLAEMAGDMINVLYRFCGGSSFISISGYHTSDIILHYYSLNSQYAFCIYRFATLSASGITITDRSTTNNSFPLYLIKI